MVGGCKDGGCKTNDWERVMADSSKRSREDLETAAANMLATLLRARYGLQSMSLNLGSRFAKVSRHIRKSQKRNRSEVNRER